MKIETLGIGIALLITVLIAVWAVYKTRQKTQSANEYFTAYGFLDKKRIFFSVFATTFSAFTVVGLPAMFFAHGIGTFWFMWIGIALTPFTIRHIGKRIVKLSISSNQKFSSPIGLLTSGYNSQTLTLVLSILTIIVLFPYLTLQIAGIGKFLVSVSGGSIGYIVGAIFCSVLVGFYVFTGGAKADAETDLIQGVILIIGTITLGVFIYFMVNDTFQESLTKLSEAQLLSIPGPKGYFTLPVLISYGIIFTLISISTPQVSQKLMGIKNIEDLKPLTSWWFYPLVGSIVVLLAGVIGLYASANLTIASPDFVAGDVIRDISTHTSGIYNLIFFGVATLFMAAVLSAAISTIDSLLLAVSGIISDNFYNDREQNQKKPKLKILTILLLVGGLIFSSQPPLFIVSLAQVQLAGLTALLPCLIGPLFGLSSKYSGWMSLVFGIVPLIIIKTLELPIIGGFDIGIVGLIGGIIGLGIGSIISKNKGGTVANNV
jgi:SSS family solute:Na+ symporter